MGTGCGDELGAMRNLSTRRRFILLAMIMVVACLIVTAVTGLMLYRLDIHDHAAQLMVTAQSQARLIEAVAQYDARMADQLRAIDPEYDAYTATLSQIIHAHERFIGHGETGEFTLARLEGDLITFVLRHRLDGVEQPVPVKFDSELAEPMRLALTGQSGTVIGLDYRGETVVAAHEPVAGLDLGIVAKIDLAEIRAPYVRTCSVAAVIALLVILAGTALFFWFANPLIRRLESHAQELVAEIEGRKQAEEELRQFNEELSSTNEELIASGEELESQYQELCETADSLLRSQEAQRESETRYRNFVSNASEGIYRIDFATPIPIDLPDEELVATISKHALVGEVNEALAQMYGLSSADMIGRLATEFSPEYGERALLVVRAPEHKVRGVDTQDVDKNGAPLYLSESYRAVVEDGILRNIWGVQLNITERKKAEKEIIDLQTRSRAWLDHSPVCTKIVDLDFNLQFMSASGVMDLGIDDINQYYGQPYPLSFYPESFKAEMTSNMLRAMETGEVTEQEAPVTDLEGNTLWFHSTIIPVLDEQSQIEYLMVVSMETTRRKQMEEQLRQVQKLESIGTLAGGVAHEINNPLMGIMNYAQLISDQLEDGNPRKADCSEIIKESNRIAVIVRNLLTFSRDDKQSHSPALITDIIENTMSLIRAVLRHDQIELEIEVPDDLPSFKCRSQQIQQVLMNLVTNARDALNERYAGYDENKVIRISAVLIERDGRKWIQTAVEDQGTGISRETARRMFDPFFTTKSREKGTGLGLSISHGIVKDHHGVLRAEGEEGTGAKFILELPVDNNWELGATDEPREHEPNG